MTYAITWRESNGLQYSGRLELTPEYVRLEGGTTATGGARHVPYDDIASVAMARSASDRIDGRQTLMLERRHGAKLLVATVGQPGALAELAERLVLRTPARRDSTGPDA
ncbi:MAG: hypothetical protein ACXWYS_00375 [Gaiellaceae bacterium]